MRAESMSFPPEPSSVPKARRFARETLRSWDLSAAAEAAEMLVSEICTNAVLHARSTYVVEVSREAETVTVRVIDGSSALPRQRDYGSDSTTGRGLRLVETLSSAWGMERLDAQGGKVVWFSVPVTGDAGRIFEEWDVDAVDVDADTLLARFRDDGDGSGSGVPPWGRAASLCCDPLGVAA